MAKKKFKVFLIDEEAYYLNLLNQITAKRRKEAAEKQQKILDNQRQEKEAQEEKDNRKKRLQSHLNKALIKVAQRLAFLTLTFIAVGSADWFDLINPDLCKVAYIIIQMLLGFNLGIAWVHAKRLINLSK